MKTPKEQEFEKEIVEYKQMLPQTEAIIIERELLEAELKGYHEGRASREKEIILLIDKWLKERTYQNKKELPALIKFMPFEWEDLKQKLAEKPKEKE